MLLLALGEDAVGGVSGPEPVVLAGSPAVGPGLPRLLPAAVLAGPAGTTPDGPCPSTVAVPAAGGVVAFGNVVPPVRRYPACPHCRLRTSSTLDRRPLCYVLASDVNLEIGRAHV